MGMAPRWFAVRPRLTDTPVNAIVFNVVVIAFLVSLDFHTILCITNFFTSAASGFEFAAALKLRWTHGQMPRPYRVPVGKAGLGLLIAVPMLLCAAVCAITATRSRVSASLVSGGLVLSVLAYVPLRHHGRGVSRITAEVEALPANPVVGALVLPARGSARRSYSVSRTCSFSPSAIRRSTLSAVGEADPMAAQPSEACACAPASEPCANRDVHTVAPLLSRGARNRGSRWCELAACLLVMVVLYIQGGAVLLAPFFSKSEPGQRVSGRIVGLIFASYPVAAALTTPIVARTIHAIGLRTTVTAGLILTVLGNVGFGLVPRVADHPAALAAGFGLCRGVAGMGGALAESGVLTSVSMQSWGPHMAKALASIEFTTGIGSALGALIGGTLYEAGARSPLGAFMLPLATAAGLSLVTAPLALAFLPTRSMMADDDDPSAGGHARGVFGHLTAWRCVPLVSLLLSAVIFEGLNPLYEPHLHAPPYQLSESRIGFLIAAICMVYTLTALPIGLLTDRILTRSATAGTRLRLLMVGGWVAFISAAAVLMPPLWSSSPVPTLLPLTLAVPLLGGATAVVIIPSLPALQHGLADNDTAGRTSLCALWNGTYAAGSALGPFLSAALYAHAGWNSCMIGMCVLSALAGAVLLIAAMRGASSGSTD